MLQALNDQASMVFATPKARARCPSCGATMIANTGQIKVWHWAHESVRECDSWAEMSKWHLDWQWHGAKRGRIEVPMGPHRADIVATDGMITEVQHSYLSVDQIREREAFYRSYGKMIWIWNTAKPFDANQLIITPKWGDFVAFDWKHARVSIAACDLGEGSQVFLDLGNGTLLDLYSMRVGGGCRGEGFLVTKEDMINWINDGIPEPREHPALEIERQRLERLRQERLAQLERQRIDQERLERERAERLERWERERAELLERFGQEEAERVERNRLRRERLEAYARAHAEQQLERLRRSVLTKVINGPEKLILPPEPCPSCDQLMYFPKSRERHLCEHCWINQGNEPSHYVYTG